MVPPQQQQQEKEEQRFPLPDLSAAPQIKSAGPQSRKGRGGRGGGYHIATFVLRRQHINEVLEDQSEEEEETRADIVPNASPDYT